MSPLLEAEGDGPGEAAGDGLAAGLPDGVGLACAKAKAVGSKAATPPLSKQESNGTMTLILSEFRFTQIPPCNGESPRRNPAYFVRRNRATR